MNDSVTCLLARKKDAVMRQANMNNWGLT